MNEIIHGDLKPSNILVGKDWVGKVSDVGQSTTLSDCGVLSSMGSLFWKSPEGSLSKESDMFALGIVMMEIFDLLRVRAQMLTEMAKWTEKIKDGWRPKALLPRIVREPIEAMLMQNPDLRPTARQICERVLDPMVIEELANSKSIPYTFVKRERMPMEKYNVPKLEDVSLSEFEHIIATIVLLL
jgi:serine/threonine protein kinase